MLSRCRNLNSLLKLPVAPEIELAECSQQILTNRPDHNTVGLPMLIHRFSEFSEKQTIVIAGIPAKRSATPEQNGVAPGTGSQS